MEKNLGLQTPIAPLRAREDRKFSVRLLVSAALAFWALWFLFRDYIIVWPASRHFLPSHIPGTEARCPQVEPLVPKAQTKELEALDEFLQSSDFRNKSIQRLSNAVQIPTQSFDDLGPVGEDPRWDVFYPFFDYLEATFPLVHASLTLEKINTHALLYTWTGTNASLKPTLLMAHQDVVPVPDSTVKQWTHPPFSGFYDGKAIWGRGASDCKNQLIGILAAVEALIEAGFTPQRTLVLSFGFDEEISGQDGAGHLAPFILERYGKNGVAVIVDEGATTGEYWGAHFATPGVAEKGHVDIDVVVRLPGGHSSIPPEHNGIGVASDLITQIEASPYDSFLDDENPYLAVLRCGAEHAPQFPKKLRKLLDKRDSKSASCAKGKKDILAIEAGKKGPEIKYLMTTSQAVDLIQGGVKLNALPERTQFSVNHRINVGSNTEAVFQHITAVAKSVADKYNLTLHAFEGGETPSSITLSYRDTYLEPAPITPTHIDPKKSNAFSILSGTTRALYGKELFVTPGIMTGNTDTRYYWDVSENIFRYGPGWDQDQIGLGNIHTVDERVGVRAHVDTIRWVVGFVRNMDEADV